MAYFQGRTVSFGEGIVFQIPTEKLFFDRFFGSNFTSSEGVLETKRKVFSETLIQFVLGKEIVRTGLNFILFHPDLYTCLDGCGSAQAVRHKAVIDFLDVVLGARPFVPALSPWCK